MVIDWLLLIPFIFCFSGIEVSYQEAVALKRQEELIREEEEEAGLLENQMKGKRGGGANEKDKRAKKKQVMFSLSLMFSSGSFLVGLDAWRKIAFLSS